MRKNSSLSAHLERKLLCPLIMVRLPLISSIDSLVYNTHNSCLLIFHSMASFLSLLRHRYRVSSSTGSLYTLFSHNSYYYCDHDKEPEPHFSACNYGLPGSQYFIGGSRVPASSSSLAFKHLNSVPILSLAPRKSTTHLLFSRGFLTRSKKIKAVEIDDHGHRAVTTALRCNFLVLSLKLGVWLVSSSHVILAEALHSLADIANQALLAYGLNSSKRAPDSTHPYGYFRERFVWSLISAVGIFCLGSGATIVNGVQNLWTSQPPEHLEYAAVVIGGSLIMESVSLVVAIQSVRKGAASEGMKVREYIWRGHDPTAVAVMTEDGASVAGLVIAGASLVAVNVTGNPIYDPIGSIVVGNLLGMVAVFLIQRNRHALIGRAIDDKELKKVMKFLKNDPVVDSVYDCKSEVIGPGFFRFKAEIDFNGVKLVQNYLNRAGREQWAKQLRKASKQKDDAVIMEIMSHYGEEVVTALGAEVDRLEKEIQEIVPGIKHVDIEAHSSIGASP